MYPIALQAEYEVPLQDWDRHLQGLADTTLAIEGGRQVPLVTKAVVTASGIAGAKLVRVAITHLRVLIWRLTGRELVEGGMQMAGRQIVRGGGWLVAGLVAVWDVADHHRLVQQNLPVLRRALGGYLDELREQVLHDPQTGIFQTLEGVQRRVLSGLGREEKGE